MAELNATQTGLTAHLDEQKVFYENCSERLTQSQIVSPAQEYFQYDVERSHRISTIDQRCFLLVYKCIVSILNGNSV